MACYVFTTLLQNYLTIDFFYLHQHKINVTAECSYSFVSPKMTCPFSFLLLLTLVDLAQNVLFFSL